MTKMLFPIAAIAMLVLAGCDNAPDAPAASPSATVQSQPDGSTNVTINLPEAMAPAVEAIANPQQTLDSLRAQAGTMNEQMKRDAVVNARRAAEAGARALGQTEVEIAQAGDVAERSAQDALGLR